MFVSLTDRWYPRGSGPQPRLPLMTGERSPRAALALVVGVTVVLSVVLSILHVPSAVLFAALIGGIAHALTSPTVLAVPAWSFRLAQGASGAVIGATVALP